MAEKARDGAGWAARQWWRVLAVACGGALALVAAGCGSSPSSHVAQLGTTSTPTTTDDAPLGGGGGPSAGVAPRRGSGSGGNFRMAMKVGANGAKYSACMRSHGVSNFPDPNGQGAIEIDSSSGVNPQSPKFQSAQKACRSLLPNGGTPTPQQQAQALQKALQFSQCMRSHGVPKFPDPQRSNGGIGIKIGTGSGVDPNSPQFKRAQQACQNLIGGPFGAKGGPAR